MNLNEQINQENGVIRERKWLAFVSRFLLVAAVMLAAYWPVLTHRYGFYDDYRLLLAARTGHTDSFVRSYVTEARALFGLAQALIYEISGDIGGLARPRALSLAGIALFCLALASLFRRAGFAPRFSLAAALLLCLTPAVGVWAAWAGLAVFGYAASLAALGGAAIWEGLGAARLAKKLALVLVGVLLLEIVFLTYSPLAAFSLLAFVAPLLARGEDDPRLTSRFALAVVVYALAAGAYFAACRLALAALPGDWQPSPRLALGWSDPRKVLCLGHMLWSGLAVWDNLHSVFVQIGTAIAMSCACLFACLAPAERGWRLRKPLFAALAVTALLSLLPVIVIEEANFSFRKFPNLQATVILTALTGAARLFARLRRRSVALERAVLTALVLGSAALARHHVYSGIVRLNAREVELCRAQIESCPTKPRPALRVIEPEPLWLRANRAGEYGVISTPNLWALTPMLQLLFEETHGDWRTSGMPEKEYFAIELVTAIGKRDQVHTIDLFDLFHANETPRVKHPYWGEIRLAPSGWCASDWFGEFDMRDFPLIRHATLDELRCAGRGIERGEFSFSYPAMGWMQTSPENFPEFFLPAKNKWVSFSLSFWPKRCFYDYEAGKWTIVP